MSGHRRRKLINQILAGLLASAVLLSFCLISGLPVQAEALTVDNMPAFHTAAEALAAKKMPVYHTAAEAGTDGIGEEALPEDQEETALDEEAYYSRALAKRSQVFDPADAKLSVPEQTKKNKEKNYTVLIYMTGSNLESRLGSATKDLEEIENSGLDFKDVNLLVYTGGAQRWVGDVPCDKNCVLDMSKKVQERIVAETGTNASMGASETLTAFLDFAAAYYPAEHNALIFWDHGGGPLWGYGSDELFDSDSLLLTEMKTAMDLTAFPGEGKKLDIVGFDACLMASFEVMSLWKNYADYYVASEELEPGDGWDYSFLDILNQTDDPEVITQQIVEQYNKYYEAAKTETFNPDVTLSCVKLSAFADLEAAFQEFSEKLEKDVAAGGFSSIMQQRFASKSFGAAENAKGTVSFYYDLADLGDLAVSFAEKYPDETAQLAEAVDDAVLYQSGNISHTNGISVYFPSRNKGQFSQMFDSYSTSGVSDAYSRFLQKNAEEWMKKKARDWTLGSPKSAKDEYTLQLTEEQQENMVSAFYTLLLPFADGYRSYVSRRLVEPDKDGRLHFPKKVELLSIDSDSGEHLLVPVSFVEADEERTVYRTENTRFLSDSLSIAHEISDCSFEEFTVTVSVDNASGKVTILSITSTDEEAGQGGKNTIDVAQWGGIYISSHPGIPTTSDDGKILPYEDWKQTGSFYINTLSINKSFSFRLLSSTEMPDSVFCQAGIEDTNGEIYASELFEMDGIEHLHTAETDTPEGKFTFEVYEDHAELISYLGTDKKLTIPKEADDKPVTVINDGALSDQTATLEEVVLPDTVTEIGCAAFSRCNKLKTVHLPEGLEKIESETFCYCPVLENLEIPSTVTSIGMNAFAYCKNLKQLSLPAGLKQLGTGAFMNCSNLESISIDEQNKYYTVKDKGLYSKDGRIFLAYPAANSGSFAVADGVEEIAYGAFTGAALNEIQLPDTLRIIDNYAFYNCSQLQVPVFPEALETIGMYAFDTSYYTYEPEDLPESPEEIRIGNNISEIGTHAFDRYVRKRFLMDQDNRHFMTIDGALMNKAADALISVGADENNNVVIPDGTVTFDLEVLEFLDNCDLYSDSAAKHIFIPKSVERIEDAILYGRRNLYFHCPENSAAEEYATSHDIPYSNDMSSDYSVKEFSTEKGVLTYRTYDGYIMITQYAGEEKTLTIPDTIDGLPVTVIGDGAETFTQYAFLEEVDDAPNLEEIVLPESLERINDRVFGATTYYKKFKMPLPESVKVIGDEALGDSIGIRIPEGIESLGSFFIRSALEDGFTLTPSVKYVAPGAFSYCSGFTEFKESGENELYCVKDGVLFSKDGQRIIAYPPEKAESYSIPEGVTRVEEGAFARTKIAEVYFPSSLKTIGEKAFESCPNLTTAVFAPGTQMETIEKMAFNSAFLERVDLPPVETIGPYAFYNCGNLKAVTFSEGLRVIDSNAFQLTGISSASLPESLSIIGDYAFNQSYYNEEMEPEGKADPIHIGKNVTKIGTSAFSGIKTEAFEVDPENENYASLDGFLTDKKKQTLYVIPYGLTGEVRIPEGILMLDDIVYSTDWTERENNTITKIYLPESIVYMNDIVFFPSNMFSATLCCKKGTYAYEFAVKNGFTVEEP